jgi:CheY-like chemotaxis protein
MTALLILLMFVAFAGIDYLVRESARRHRVKRERQAREAVLDLALRLDFTDEAKSLKRVEVSHPKARILAVDDEPVVLDSFRRILVLEGYNVDTVETGPEALGLVQRNDYDFVFTDLKMPEMSGVEVVKAVKHLRPDADVVVITGYGTIETAVETLQFGASEYVQKPFTADELAEFARKLLIKREARLEAQRQPTVRIVSPSTAESVPDNEFCVPGGAFIAPGHTWVRIEPNGQIRIGIDDFARKALGPINEVLAPSFGRTIQRGETLFTLKHGSEFVHFAAPLSGRVTLENNSLQSDAAAVGTSPYDRGWICMIQPSDLTRELPSLRIGKPVVAWYQEEIKRLRETQAAQGSQTPGTRSLDMATFEQQFLVPAAKV